MLGKPPKFFLFSLIVLISLLSIYAAIGLGATFAGAGNLPDFRPAVSDGPPAQVTPANLPGESVMPRLRAIEKRLNHRLLQRQGQQRADRLVSRFLKGEQDLEDRQYRPRLHVVRCDVEPVAAVRDGDLRVRGRCFCACTTKFPAMICVQSNGWPASSSVIGTIPEITWSSGTHTPFERNVMICNTERRFM